MTAPTITAGATSDATAPTLPRVVAYRSVAELRQWAQELHALNVASRRPSPFVGVEFLDAYLSNDEKEPAGSQPLVLVAFDGARPIGYLALRRGSQRWFGRGCVVELLVTHTAGRQTLVAAPEDELRCARAFIRHLTEMERGWTFLRLVQQDGSFPLASLPGLDRRRYHVRRLPNEPGTVIELAGTTFARWAERTKDGHWKRFVRRVRSLLAAGRVEFVACEATASAEQLLDLYMELESRSWKANAHAGVARHPRRIALFRRMLRLRSCEPPVFHFVLFDDVPIAGLLSLHFGDTLYGMVTAFDDAFARFAPGNLLYMLAVRDAIERGVRAFDLLSNFAYYKVRLGATITETWEVQAFRRGSRYHLRARLGELQRRLFGARFVQQFELSYNRSRREERERAAAETSESPPMVAVSDANSRRTATAAVLAAVERAGGLTRLGDEALIAALPFEVPRRKPVTAPMMRRRE